MSAEAAPAKLITEDFLAPEDVDQIAKGTACARAVESRVARGDLIGFAQAPPPADHLLAAGHRRVRHVVLEDLVVVILEGLEASLGDAEGAEVADRAVSARGEGRVEEADAGDWLPGRSSPLAGWLPRSRSRSRCR